MRRQFDSRMNTWRSQSMCGAAPRRPTLTMHTGSSVCAAATVCERGRTSLPRSRQRGLPMTPRRCRCTWSISGASRLPKGRLDEAQAVFTQAVTLGREVDFPIAVGLSLGGLAPIVHARGDSVRARRTVRPGAAHTCRRPGDAADGADARRPGQLALEEADLPRFAEHLNNALELGVRLGHREALLAALEGVAIAVAPDGPGCRVGRAAVRRHARLRELSPSGPPQAAVEQMSSALAALGTQLSQDLLGEGRGLTLEDAVTLARALLADTATVDSGASSAEPTLTGEIEVADLLARAALTARLPTHWSSPSERRRCTSATSLPNSA